jgi:hypothetical protein
MLVLRAISQKENRHNLPLSIINLSNIKYIYSSAVYIVTTFAPKEAASFTEGLSNIRKQISIYIL